MQEQETKSKRTAPREIGAPMAKAGLEGPEAKEEEGGPEPGKLLSFPHLVFKEFIALMLMSLLLIIVSMVINAPLEEEANPSKTPNPSKAPWYFVGLQEMLVYFDPWIAGVIAPLLIIIGLSIVPYVDRNPRGVGGYAGIKQRSFAVTIFSIGVFAWFALIIFGYYLRGPAWLVYMPWESWDIHKPLISPGGVVLPLHIGGAAILAYFGLGIALPIIFARRFYRSLGPTRYFITMFFVLCMFGFLAKIPLRLVFSIKYILMTPWFRI
ncbi:MAG TPA: cytochrome C [Candidatus Hypogeohydataceae bacterium YC41]